MDRLRGNLSLRISLAATVIIIIYVINIYTIKNDFLTNWILLPLYIFLAFLYITIYIIDKSNIGRKKRSDRDKQNKYELET